MALDLKCNPITIGSIMYLWLVGLLGLYLWLVWIVGLSTGSEFTQEKLRTRDVSMKTE